MRQYRGFIATGGRLNLQKVNNYFSDFGVHRGPRQIWVILEFDGAARLELYSLSRRTEKRTTYFTVEGVVREWEAHKELVGHPFEYTFNTNHAIEWLKVFRKPPRCSACGKRRVRVGEFFVCGKCGSTRPVT